MKSIWKLQVKRIKKEIEYGKTSCFSSPVQKKKTKPKYYQKQEIVTQ